MSYLCAKHNTLETVGKTAKADEHDVDIILCPLFTSSVKENHYKYTLCTKFKNI